MSTPPSAQYSLTLRVEIDHKPGMLGQVAGAIGGAGGVIGAVDLVEVGERLIRDITVDAAGREHWAAMRSQSPDQVRATVENVLARDASPSMLLAAADAYFQIGDKAKRDALHERILSEFPASLATQWVLKDRYMSAADRAAVS